MFKYSGNVFLNPFDYFFLHDSASLKADQYLRLIFVVRLILFISIVIFKNFQQVFSAFRAMLPSTQLVFLSLIMNYAKFIVTICSSFVYYELSQVHFNLYLCQWPHIAHSFILYVFVATTLISASIDTINQWNLECNSCIRTFRGHSAPVSCLAAVDAHRLLSGDYNGSVFLWDIASGQQLASVKAHSKKIHCLAVAPDGCSFVSSSNGLKLWRFAALQQPVIQFSVHTREVLACVVASDGSRLYSGSFDMIIRVWDMTTGQQVASLQSHTGLVSGLALSGSLLVSGSFDNTVKLWDTGSLRLLHTLRGHSDWIYTVAVSSDGSQRVLSGGGVTGSKDYSVRVWDAASGAQLAVLQGHSDAVRCIRVSSNGRLAASASNDGIICVWNLVSLSLCAKLEGRASPMPVLFVWFVFKNE